jgi:CDP-diacylglycerol--glycerol-3-phosphate 3-phosphatidyltransferase
MKHPVKSLWQELTCAPNLVTLFRIGAIPAVLLLMNPHAPTRNFYAAVVFGIASASDALDGYLARRSGNVTVLGKFLDPLADKLLVMATLVYMVNLDRVDAWLAALLIGRELAITGLRAIASSEGLVIAASAGGKNKTAFQLAGIAALILHFPYPLLGTPFVVDFHVVGIYLVYISLLFSVFSAIEYIQLFVEAAEDEQKRSVPVRDLEQDPHG